MKDYKRLTQRRGGLVIDNCGNCSNISSHQGCTNKKCYEIMKNRLVELEDKIESGQLCDREFGGRIMSQNFGKSEAMYFEGKWMFHFSVSSYWSW